jgi:hypothetical protein
MIEHGMVDGKPATIGYFDDEWKPRDKDQATLCKVHYDDDRVGVIAILRLRPPPDKPAIE